MSDYTNAEIEAEMDRALEGQIHDLVTRCRRCNGEGRFWAEVAADPGTRWHEWVTCPQCGGTGAVT